MSEPAGSWKMQFPGNLAWSNAVLVTQGMAPYDAVALAEIDTVCARLAHARSGPEAWRDEWVAMGEHIEARATPRRAFGHERSAGHAWLRAGMYYFTASASSTRGPRSAPLASARSAASRPACCAAIRASRRSRCRSKAHRCRRCS
jgi:hypothetical protein